MNPMRAQYGLWLAIIAGIAAITGCANSRLEAEIDRLQVQLKQADQRLAVATTQIEAANAQVVALKQSLEQAQAEIKNVTAALQQKADAQRDSLEQRNAKAVASLNESRQQLAAAQTQLDEVAKQKAELSQQRSVLGVWEVNLLKLGVHPAKYRFAFYQDGDIVVQRGEVLRLLDKEEISWKPSGAYNDDPESRMIYRRTSPNEFALLNRSGRLDAPEGRFVVRPDGSGEIQHKHFPLDKYGKPKWHPAQKLAEIEDADKVE